MQLSEKPITADPAACADFRDRDLRAEGLVLAEGRLLAERLLRAARDGRPGSAGGICPAAPAPETLSGAADAASAGQAEYLKQPSPAPRFIPLRLLCVPALEDHFRPLCEGLCDIEVEPEAVCAKAAGYPFHRGALLLARRPALRFLEDLSSAELADIPSFIVLPATADPENIGSIIRSSAALGYGAIALGPGCCDPYSRKALRTSMGAAFSLPAFALRGPAALAILHGAGFEIAAAVLGQGARPLKDYRLAASASAGKRPRAALLIGNEYDGLGPEWLGPEVERLTIPMAAGSDSLNAAVAAAIFMYEVSQRAEGTD